jgi:hypothetical protein
LGEAFQRVLTASWAERVVSFTIRKGQRMKPRLILVAVFFLAVAPFATAVDKTRRLAEVEPPQLENNLADTGSEGNTLLADLVAIKPEIPLGPPDLLNEYEDGMALIAQNMSAEMGTILQAQRAKQITSEQAEYLIRERYQVAMMRHQVLSALHDMLESDIAQAAAQIKRLGQAGDSDAVVVESPAFGRSRDNQ